MDLMTIVGFIAGFGLLYYGANQGVGLSTFLNMHGLAIVIGGTAAMTLVNSSAHLLINAFRACVRLFFPVRQEKISRVIAMVRGLAEQSRENGVLALQNLDKRFAGGFLERVANVAVMSGEPEFVRMVLEEDILQTRLRHQAVIGALRTVGVISPMVGLLGTLIGIVSVLQQITDPTKVGPAMATALSTAFYGILLSAFFAVPVAGKLRERSNQETLVKQILLEGIIGILKKEPAYLLEIRLRSFAQERGLPAMSAPPMRGQAA
jgi:chemotaxis protein MotA